jgi:hypothetical protein
MLVRCVFESLVGGGQVQLGHAIVESTGSFALEYGSRMQGIALVEEGGIASLRVRAFL